MTRRDINLVLAGGAIGWLAAMLTLILFPVDGERWNIVGMVAVVYPIVFVVLVWVADWWRGRTTRPSEASTDA